MSTTYIPRKKRSVARTAFSYADGSFDANVDAGQWIGRVHQYLELPLEPFTIKHPPVRAPFLATAAQTRAWAERLTLALEVFRSPDNLLFAWRDFLKTCGGYEVLL